MFFQVEGIRVLSTSFLNTVSLHVLPSLVGLTSLSPFVSRENIRHSLVNNNKEDITMKHFRLDMNVLINRHDRKTG